MNLTDCASIQSSFSAYLDGAVTGHEMQEITRHLYGSQEDADGNAPCETCSREFAAWRRTQNALAMMGPAKAPADLGLKLRLAISREKARREFRLLDRLALAWDNAIRPIMVQVSAGFAATIVLVGGIAFMLSAAPPPVLANDEPLGAMTAPHYLYSIASPGAVTTGHDSPVVVEVAIDSTGRVYDYNIVSGTQNEAVRTQVASQLLNSIFQPASFFGLPVRGHSVITFAGISVHG